MKQNRERGMKYLKELFRTAMDPEQEREFEQLTEKRCWKIFLPAGIVIMLFQVYNIVYTLQYTDFTLRTAASRVYTVLYAVLLAVTAAAFAVRRAIVKKNENESHRCLLLYQGYGMALLFWSACISVYDQRVSDNLNVYIITAIGIAVMIYLKPLVSISGFCLTEAFIFAAMPQFQPGEMSEHYGSYVNSVLLVITAVFISVYRYWTMRADFEKQMVIARQNREILQKSEALDYLASHDTLTELWNRRFLERFLEEWMQDRAQKELAVLMIDVDYFKQYNDTYGHQRGDECLRRVSAALNLVIGKGMLFRYGGEEFLCIYPEAGEKETEKLGKELCRSVERLAVPGGIQGQAVTVSVGWARGTVSDREEFENLLGKADQALYRAKLEGRNRAVGEEHRDRMGVRDV